MKMTQMERAIHFDLDHACRDIQSYISRAFLYFAPLSKKVFILVDNQPWLTTKQSRSARIWQFMVTKVIQIASRVSSMANSCLRPDHRSQ